MELVQLMLTTTVMRDGGAGVRLDVPRKRKLEGRTRILGRAGGEGGLIPLRDGRWLKLIIVLFMDRDDKDKLKVYRSTFQYQCDESDDRWIVRYEFTRIQIDQHPTMHVHINGTLAEPSVLPESMPLGRIHFPTYRISIEAVIRMLIDQFGVQSREPAEVWRPLLTATETRFFEHARRNPSGPAR